MTDITTQTKIAAPWTLGVLWERAADGGIDDANVSASDGTAISIFGPHAKEKAHLIAAAPALYEALSVVVSNKHNEYWTVEEQEAAHAALRLARGEG